MVHNVAHIVEQTIPHREHNPSSTVSLYIDCYSYGNRALLTIINFTVPWQSSILSGPHICYNVRAEFSGF